MFRLNEPMPYVMTAIAAALMSGAILLSPQAHETWMWKMAASSVVAGIFLATYGETDSILIRTMLIGFVAGSIGIVADPEAASAMQNLGPAAMSAMAGATMGMTIGLVAVFIPIKARKDNES